jgi:hypothetical protein
MFEAAVLVLVGGMGLVLLAVAALVGLAVVKGLTFLVALPFKMAGWLLGLLGSLLGLAVGLLVLVAIGAPVLLIVLPVVLGLLAVVGLPLLLLALLAGAVAG